VTLAEIRLHHELALLVDELLQLAEKRHLPMELREAYRKQSVAPRREPTILGYLQIRGTPRPAPVIDTLFHST
jgi:hypothetical protein